MELLSDLHSLSRSHCLKNFQERIEVLIMGPILSLFMYMAAEGDYKEDGPSGSGTGGFGKEG